MRSWIESLGRASSAPPRLSLMPGRTSCRELLEQSRLQLGRSNAARTRLQHAADLRAADVDATSRADALEFPCARPARERASADRNIRGREDGGGFRQG